jgi:SAM-dependent methyltransferase
MRGPSTDVEVAAERVAAAFDALAARWDGTHGPWSPRSLGFWLRTGLLRSLILRQPPPRRVLDIGCGTGRHLLAVADRIAEGVGVDIAPAMVERARQHAQAAGRMQQFRFEVRAVEQLGNWAEAPFDLAMFLGSLEHMPDPARAVADAAALLRPDGLLVAVLLHPHHPLGRRAERGSRDGSMPPLRLILPEQMTGWAAAAGLARIPLAAPSSGWTAYAVLNALLAGRRHLLFRRAALSGDGLAMNHLVHPL